MEKLIPPYEEWPTQRWGEVKSFQGYAPGWDSSLSLKTCPSLFFRPYLLQPSLASFYALAVPHLPALSLYSTSSLRCLGQVCMMRASSGLGV